MARRTTEPRRSEYIKINVDAETKKRLQAIADEKGWALSLLCYKILQERLKEDENEIDK